MTPEAWLRTSDVVAERGQLRIVDRKKKLNLVSGSNVYPNEIEDVVSQMPGLLRCAVVGVPDAKAREAVMLVVVGKDDTRTEADVRTFCEQQLTGCMNPSRSNTGAICPSRPWARSWDERCARRPDPG